MERRDLLKATGLVAAGGVVYGGVRYLRGIQTPGPVESVEFRGIHDEHDDHPWMGTPVQPGDEPEITVDNGGSRLTVEGFHWYGSSSCNTSVFDGIEYDEEEDMVRAVVESRRQRSSYLALGCTADLASTPYHLTVTFDDPPERFVMVENHSGATETTVVEIDK